MAEEKENITGTARSDGDYIGAARRKNPRRLHKHERPLPAVDLSRSREHPITDSPWRPDPAPVIRDRFEIQRESYVLQKTSPFILRRFSYWVLLW